MTYHVALTDRTAPACGRLLTGDQVVPWAEAMSPQGRHFNCVECHKALTGGEKHASPPLGWTGDP